MNVVGIIEYGAGNLDSVARAVEYCGGTPLVTQSPKDLRSANRLILPGVGSFAAGIHNLRERGYEGELYEQVIAKKIPFLGICLGMQFLASLGMEPVATSGLGWIDGRVIRLKSAFPGEKVPHMGWNSVAQVKTSPLFAGIQSDKDFYFVHSYHFEVANVADVITTTSYCGGFVSSVSRDNIFGVQFHPEKSQRVGFQLLKNFLAM